MLIVAHAITDLDGRFLEVDTAFNELLLLDSKEIYQKTILDVTFEDDRNTNRDHLCELAEFGTPFCIRKRYVRSDGSLLWVSNFVSRTLSRDGVSRVVASVRRMPDDECEIAETLAKIKSRLRRPKTLERDFRRRCRSGALESDPRGG